MRTVQSPGDLRLRQPLHFVQTADLRPKRDFHDDLRESAGWGWGGQRPQDLAEGSQAAFAPLDAGLRQRENLGQRRAVGQQVGGHQLVARRDHDRFAHPQAQRDRGVAVKRQAVLVAHGGQKEIQHDRLVGQPRGMLPQKTAINPRPALPRRAAHAVGNQDLLGNHKAFVSRESFQLMPPRLPT